MHYVAQSPSSSPEAPSGGISAGSTGDIKALLPFDILRVALGILSGSLWTILAGAIAGAAAFAAVWWKFEPQHTAQVQIVRREAPNTFQATELGESYQPQEFNSATISAMMRSDYLLEKSGQAFDPPIGFQELQRALTIRREKNTDLISIAFTMQTAPEEVADLVNVYARNVVEMTRELQTEEAKELLAFAAQQTTSVDDELAEARRALESYTQDSGLFNADREIEAYLKQLGDLDLKIELARIDSDSIASRLAQLESELSKQSPALQKLYVAEEALSELLLRYTEEHPSVVDQRARVDMLRHEAGQPQEDATDSFRSTGNTVANQLYIDLLTLRGNRERLGFEIEQLIDYRNEREQLLEAIPSKQLQYNKLQDRIRMLEETRHLVDGRRREALLFAERPIGYYRLFSPASVDAVVSTTPLKRSLAAALLGAGLVMALLAGCFALRAASDRRIVSPSDLRRLTRRPVIATLPPLEELDEAARRHWQFLLWQRFSLNLPDNKTPARITGFLSASSGEGKSTWIRHLARAASERHQKVLVIANESQSQPQPQSESQSESEPRSHPASLGIDEALNDPHRVLAHLRGSAHGALELHVAAGYWNATTRDRWRKALSLWKEEPDLVVLVELSSASDAETLLLAETLPFVVWLCESGVNWQCDLASLLRTIRESGIALGGAVLNRMPTIFERLPDLARFGFCVCMLALFDSHVLQAQVSAAPDPVATSAAAPDPSPAAPAAPLAVPQDRPKLESWQERLTLGAGDVLNFQVYGHPELTRREVPIGPDGTITFLQVHDFPAAGLTIDELREQLTAAIARFITNARVIVTPSAFNSKKYFLLGTVLDRGTYSLDRPMTLLEAAARARGISTGLSELNTVEIADMRRAFIVRDGKKLDIDFTRLFYGGDLSQNIQLHPGDYIHIPSNVVNEVFVLGAVDSPGQTGINESLTALAAITIRGGFSPGAWKKRVLVVRNALSEQPQVTVVDAQAIIDGRKKDMLLEPRDLVFVSQRPWRQAEEVLDVAIRSFLQSATATSVGENVGPFFP